MLPPDQVLRFERLLARVRYKPNVRFELRPEYSDILVIMRVPPSPLAPADRSEIEVCSRILLDRCEFEMPDEVFLRVCLRGGIQMAEMHELDEWLLFEGKHLVDPHPPIGRFEGLDRH